jgi:ABC-type proline/glycine betaine transport system permease subunit
MKKLFVLSGSLLGIAPLIALAQSAGPVGCNVVANSTLQAVVCKIAELLNTIIPILIVLGVVFFIWGVVQYMIGGDEEAKKKGRDKIIYGLIGLVVIVGMWGLVRIVTNTFDLNSNQGFIPPCVPGTPGC